MLQGYIGPSNFCNNDSGDSEALDSTNGVQGIKLRWGTRNDLNLQNPIIGSPIFGIIRVIQSFRGDLEWSSLYFNAPNENLLTSAHAQQIIQNNK